jgi:hypothetical protein
MPLFLLVSDITVTVFPRHLMIFFVLVIPLLLDDTRRVMESWGASGKFDPFVNVYEVSIASRLFVLHILTTIHIPALIPAYYSWFVKQRNF